MTWIATGIMAATTITIAIVKSEQAKKAKKNSRAKRKGRIE
jgi:preprotein translocase subunit SecG